MKCELTSRDGIQGWCDRHHRYHTGHNEKYATGDDDASIKRRELWDASTNKPPDPKLLRSPATAKRCLHLVPQYVSNGEAHTLGEQLRDTAAKLNTRCSGCNGKTTLQRCTGGGGVNGFTTLAWCSAKCVDKFQQKEAT